MSIYKILCKICGPRDEPCEHMLEHEELKLLREIYAKTVIILERVDRNQGLFAKALSQIIHDLNRPQSATLKLIFQEALHASDNPSQAGQRSHCSKSGQVQTGTGTVVPNAGAIAFTRQITRQ